MRKIVRALSLLCACIVIMGMPISVSAQEQQEGYAIIGTYDEGNKEQVIADIRANDPNALIFESVEEANIYISELRQITLTESTVNIARSYRTTKHLQVNVGVTCYVNVYYDYFVDVGGIVLAIYPDTVYSSMTGLSPGVTYQENYLSVRQSSDTHIATDLMFTLNYYLLVDNLIHVASEDFRYKFDHDCCSNTTTWTQLY